MYVVNLREPKTLIVLLLVAGLMLGLVFFQLDRVETYSSMTLAEVPWGNEPGEAGRQLGQDGKFYGPRSLAVGPGGRIYLADTFNHRVLIFTRDGKLEKTISLASAGPSLLHDLAVDRAGRIFLADNRAQRILVYSREGVLLRELAFEGSKSSDIWFIERAALDQEGRLFLATAEIGPDQYERTISRLDLRRNGRAIISVATLTPNGLLRMGSESLIAGNPNSFVVEGGLLYTESAGAGPFERAIRVYDPGGRLRREFAFTSSEILGTVALVGVDGKGGVYVGVRLGSPEARVLKLDGSGRIQAEISLDSSDMVFSNVYARVDPKGNVYYLAPGTEGLQIRRAERRSSWRLVPTSKVR